MSQNASRTFTISGVGASYQCQHALAGNIGTEADVALAPSGAYVPVNLAITLASTQAIMLACDQNATVYTNAPSGGSLQDTITLTGGKEKYWDIDSLGTIALLFAGNVTKMWVTNNTSTASTFSIRLVTN